MIYEYNRDNIGLFTLIAVTTISFGLDYQVAKTLLHTCTAIAIFLIIKDPRSTSTQRTPLILFTPILAISATIVFINSYNSESQVATRFLKDFTIPALCFAVIILKLKPSKKEIELIPWIFAIATLSMAIPAITDQYSHTAPHYRTSGSINLPLIFASNLSILCISTFAMLMGINPKDKSILFTLCIIAITMGTWAIGLSGSRGPLLSLLVITGVLFIKKSIIHIGAIKSFSIMGIVLSAVVFAGTHLSISDRFTAGFRSIQENDKESSVGLRLEAWRAAADIIYEHPVLGVGTGNHLEIIKNRQAADVSYVPELVTTFIHLHNDVINAVVWFGIPFGLLFLSFVWYPAVFATRFSKASLSTSINAAVCVYALNGLTNTPSIRATSVTLFLLVVSLLMAAASHSDAENKDSAS